MRDHLRLQTLAYDIHRVNNLDSDIGRYIDGQRDGYNLDKLQPLARLVLPVNIAAF